MTYAVRCADRLESNRLVGVAKLSGLNTYRATSTVDKMYCARIEHPIRVLLATVDFFKCGYS